MLLLVCFAQGVTGSTDTEPDRRQQPLCGDSLQGNPMGPGEAGRAEQPQTCPRPFREREQRLPLGSGRGSDERAPTAEGDAGCGAVRVQGNTVSMSSCPNPYIALQLLGSVQPGALSKARHVFHAHFTCINKFDNCISRPCSLSSFKRCPAAIKAFGHDNMLVAKRASEPFTVDAPVQKWHKERGLPDYCNSK